MNIRPRNITETCRILLCIRTLLTTSSKDRSRPQSDNTTTTNTKNSSILNLLLWIVLLKCLNKSKLWSRKLISNNLCRGSSNNMRSPISTQLWTCRETTLKQCQIETRKCLRGEHHNLRTISRSSNRPQKTQTTQIRQDFSIDEISSSSISKEMRIRSEREEAISIKTWPELTNSNHLLTKMIWDLN